MQSINNIDISAIQNDKIWLFNSAGEFSGNVKALFLYITQYHKDIVAYYISGDDNNVKHIQSLGFKACSFKSKLGISLMQQASVYVTEQVKKIYPKELHNCIQLNLFHGVGLKIIEKLYNRDEGFFGIMEKHIKYTQYLSHYMCFLVTSPFMEQHFKEQLNLRNDQLIRGAYPRCTPFQDKELTKTFNHDILVRQKLSSDTKIMLYAPTYRDHENQIFLYKAIPDLDKLLKVLKKNNILLILKLHTRSSKDPYTKKIYAYAQKNTNLLLWDNKEDIYEIFNKIDIAVVDYSSIFYDLLASGIKQFVRYIFDFENYKTTLNYDYFQNTTGSICMDFESLLETIENKSIIKQDTKQLTELNDKFWSYNTSNNCDNIIEQVLNFKPKLDIVLKNLYSFDVFDTIIARKVGEPRGVFFGVMEKIKTSNKDFPLYFHTEYVAIRMQAESNVREFIRKDKGFFEISFDDIFIRLAELYHLTDEQSELLKEWELEFELENVIPLFEQLERIEELLEKREIVILISDMYLPKAIIQKMLTKANSILASLPLFLSSELGVQKSTSLLYKEVYKHFSPWNFKEWNHIGDNKISDFDQAKKFGIQAQLISKPQFNSFENALINRHKNYDMFIIAGIMARMRTNTNIMKEYFAFSYISSYLVPYVAWTIRDAINRNISTLYFLSRDGFFLKKIADEYIFLHKLNIKTKYIFTSRRLLRVPSFIEDVDEEFFSEFGAIIEVKNYDVLLEALDISDKVFQELFPELMLNKNSTFTLPDLINLRIFFKNSTRYKEYLLRKAIEKRKIVVEYLKQEINFNEEFAFVEFWARGYTQTCFSRLLDYARNQNKSTIFYYFRSILPSIESNIRINYSTNNTNLSFIEAIFANAPYSSVKEYQYKHDGTIIPKLRAIPYDTELYNAMNDYLPIFVNEFYGAKFMNPIEVVERSLSDSALYWYRDKQDDNYFIKCLAHLKVTQSLYEQNIREFAPKFNEDMLKIIKDVKQLPATSSIKMSIARSTPKAKELYSKLLNNKHVVQKSNNVSSKNLNILSKKEKLYRKISCNPEQFFADSKYIFVRTIGKLALSPILRNSLGELVIHIAKKILK